MSWIIYSVFSKYRNFRSSGRRMGRVTKKVRGWADWFYLTIVPNYGPRPRWHCGQTGLDHASSSPRSDFHGELLEVSNFVPGYFTSPKVPCYKLECYSCGHNRSIARPHFWSSGPRRSWKSTSAVGSRPSARREVSSGTLQLKLLSRNEIDNLRRVPKGNNEYLFCMANNLRLLISNIHTITLPLHRVLLVMEVPDGRFRCSYFRSSDLGFGGGGLTSTE